MNFKAIGTTLKSGGKTGAFVMGGVMALAVPFVADWEGLRTNAYLDAVNVPTICYGHTEGVYIGQEQSREECGVMLQEELGDYLAYVDGHVTMPLSQLVRAALASFTYNIGKGAFARSSALRKINAGDVAGGCNAIATREINAAGVCRGYGCGWAGGRQLRGLSRRRESEKALCLEGV